jgi:hypothetical protein
MTGPLLIQLLWLGYVLDLTIGFSGAQQSWHLTEDIRFAAATIC